MSEKSLIAFIGEIGVGKSTAADILSSSFGYIRVSFADPLKQMLKTLGLEHEQVYGGRKEEHEPLLCGQTPRHAMQTLGTEWGRNLIGNDLWVNAWQRKVQSVRKVVVDDARFMNEFRTIHELNGKLIRIYRKGVDRTTPQESENYLSAISVDYHIHNTGDLKAFRKAVLFCVNHLI